MRRRRGEADSVQFEPAVAVVAKSDGTSSRDDCMGAESASESLPRTSASTCTWHTFSVLGDGLTASSASSCDSQRTRPLSVSPEVGVAELDRKRSMLVMIPFNLLRSSAPFMLVSSAESRRASR